MTAMPNMPTAWQPKKPTLFSLTEEMQQLDDQLTESLGELTPEVEAALATLGASIRDKTDSIAWFLKTCEAREDCYRKAAAELQAKAKVEEAKRDRLKAYVKLCMELLGASKLQGEVYAFAIQRNGGKAPVKLLEPYASQPDLLPRDLTRITVTPDWDRIRELPSPSQFHEVLPVGTHVRVR